jgi:hypothetical protein
MTGQHGTSGGIILQDFRGHSQASVAMLELFLMVVFEVAISISEKGGLITLYALKLRSSTSTEHVWAFGWAV